MLNENQEQLIVTQLNHIPHLEFGPASVGDTLSKLLVIQNPSKDTDATIRLGKFTKDVGFHIDLDFVTVHAGEFVNLQVLWIPKSTKSVRASVQFILNERFRMQCVLIGKIQKLKAKPERKRVPLRMIQATTEQPERSLSKRSVVYDEKWMEKQQHGFQAWINYTICSESEEEQDEKDNHLSILAQKQQQGFVRRRAVELYHSETMDTVLYNIEREVNEGRLAIRTDRLIHVDLGLQDLLTELLLSYHPMWLRLGLEIILGQVLQSKSDRMLTKIIVERFIKHPDISTKTKEGVHELRGIFLVRFLLLVYFLDTVRQEGKLLSNIPCLFRTEAKLKTSSSVLGEFCKHFLRAEGNIIRHLNGLGYKVTYQQQKLDEFDVTVTNLAIDLRDGVRLVCLTDKLCHTMSRKSLRLPAVSRLQKIHNVNLALNDLSRNGIAMKQLNAKDIVDGNREKTLGLLWNIMSHFKLAELVDKYQLRHEINAVISRMSHRAFDLFTKQQQVISSTGDPLQRTLMEWCRAVGACYGLAVPNLTDPRVVCYLIHYYHPELVSRSDIHTISNNTALINRCIRNLGCIPILLPDVGAPEEKMMTALLAFLQSRLFDSSKEIRAVFYLQRWWKRLIQQKRNKAALMIQHAWINANHLRLAIRRCRRLLHFSRQIKRSVRRYILRRRLKKHLQQRHLAACRIQSLFLIWQAKREFSRQRLKRLVEMAEAERHKEIRNRAIVQLQSMWRMYSCRKHQKQRQLAVYRIQSMFLVLRAKREVLTRRRLQRLEEEKLEAKRNRATLYIQTAWRGYRCRQLCLIHQHRCAAYMIQSFFLILQAKRELGRRQLQRLVQRAQEVKLHQQRISGAIYIQTMWRGYRCRKLCLIQQRRCAAYKIQSAFVILRAKRELSRRRLQRLVQRVELDKKKNWAAISIQTMWRGYRCRKLCLIYQRRCAAYRIQSFFLILQAKRELGRRQLQRLVQMAEGKKLREKRNYAAISIQTVWRGYGCRKLCLIHQRRRAVYRIQSFFLILQAKRELSRRQLQQLEEEKKLQEKRNNDAAIKGQSMWRMYCCKKKYVSLKQNDAAARFVQAIYREYLNRRRYLKWRDSQMKKTMVVVKVQSLWRAYRCRQLYEFLQRNKKAARLIQSTWRGYFHRQRYLVARHELVERRIRASISIQSTWKRYLMYKRYRQMRSILYKSRRRRLEQSVRHLQLRFRQRLIEFRAAFSIQTIWRRHMTSKRYVAARYCRRIQALYRGYRIRKTRPSHTNWLSQPTDRSDRLLNRMLNALQVFENSSSLGQMIFASQTLELCTRYSNECCQSCIDVYDLHETLISGMRGCNRSLPHLQLLEKLLLTLRNLAKFQKKVLYSSTTLDTLMDIVQMHRDRDVLFDIATGLLYRAIELQPRRGNVVQIKDRLQRMNRLLSKRLNNGKKRRRIEKLLSLLID